MWRANSSTPLKTVNSCNMLNLLLKQAEALKNSRPSFCLFRTTPWEKQNDCQLRSLTLHQLELQEQLHTLQSVRVPQPLQGHSQITTIRQCPPLRARGWCLQMEDEAMPQKEHFWVLKMSRQVVQCLKMCFTQNSCQSSHLTNHVNASASGSPSLFAA